VTSANQQLGGGVFSTCGYRSNRKALTSRIDSITSIVQDFSFFLRFFCFEVPPLSGPALPPCISAIISLNRLSLTPPPLMAAECRGKMSPIFQPRGIAGGGGGLEDGAIPAIRRRRGEVSVVGCAFKYSATLM